MGGATFPTQVKLSPPPGNTAEVLIINGVERTVPDSRSSTDAGTRSRTDRRNRIVDENALHVQKAIIGVENNKSDAIQLLRQEARKVKGIEVYPLQIKYPQGGEKQLIQATTGKHVPSGALPIAVGAVVQNVGTVYAVYEAVMKHKPLFERVVTVTGKSLKEPGNYLCRIGTPITKLIEAAGGLSRRHGKKLSAVVL